MDVVWTYRDYRYAPVRYKNKVDSNCELLLDQEFEAFVYSVLSWKIFEPKIRRVIYIDRNVEKYLKPTGILSLFNEVVITSFMELDVNYPNLSFFAAPKLYVLSKLENPSFIIDTETLLLSPLSKWYSPGTYYGMRYERTNPITFENWNEDSIKGFKNLQQEFGEDGKFLDPVQMINAGYTVWENLEVAHSVGKKALEIAERVCMSEVQFSQKWTFCEESILFPLIRYFDSTADVVFHPAVDETNSWPIIEFSSPGQSESVHYFLRDVALNCLGEEVESRFRRFNCMRNRNRCV